MEKYLRQIQNGETKRDVPKIRRKIGTAHRHIALDNIGINLIDKIFYYYLKRAVYWSKDISLVALSNGSFWQNLQVV